MPSPSRTPAAVVAAASTATAAAAGRPLRVGSFGLWDDTAGLLGEVDLFRRMLTRASGRDVVVAASLGEADVILLGVFAARASVLATVEAHKSHAVTVFVSSENDFNFWAPTPTDHLVGVADVSLGHRLDLTAPSFVRTPWWLFASPFTLTQGGAFELPAGLTAPTDPAAWLARQHFTAVVVRDTPYPRQAMVAQFRSMGRGQVLAPGRAAVIKNMEWPACLPNTQAGKVEFLRAFRFNICAENSRTAGGGYHTEKVMHAHLGGAVPVYWGDTPFDGAVWNPARVLIYNGTPESAAALNVTVARLHDDAAFRAAFFAQPVLAPTAQAWLREWAARVDAVLRAALRQRLPGV
jgi:hypothetical protein